MNPKTVKTKINQMIRAFGSHEAVANELHVSLSYVYMLKKGTKKASPTLLTLIDLIIQKIANKQA